MKNSFQVDSKHFRHTVSRLQLTWNHFQNKRRKSNSSFIYTHVTSPIKEQRTNMNTKDKRNGLKKLHSLKFSHEEGVQQSLSREFAWEFF